MPPKCSWTALTLSVNQLRRPRPAHSIVSLMWHWGLASVEAASGPVMIFTFTFAGFMDGEIGVRQRPVEGEKTSKHARPEAREKRQQHGNARPLFCTRCLGVGASAFGAVACQTFSNDCADICCWLIAFRRRGGRGTKKHVAEYPPTSSGGAPPNHAKTLRNSNRSAPNARSAPKAEGE
jgi:hypothetical protein